jgi:hypothetical protein
MFGQLEFEERATRGLGGDDLLQPSPRRGVGPESQDMAGGFVLVGDQSFGADRGDLLEPGLEIPRTERAGDRSGVDDLLELLGGRGRWSR